MAIGPLGRRTAQAVDESTLAQRFVDRNTLQGAIEGITQPTTSLGQTAVKFGAPSAAVGVAAFPASDAYTEMQHTQQRQSQEELANSIRNDPTLTPEQKSQALQELARGGAFSDPGQEPEEDSLLGGLLPSNLLSTETLLIVVALLVLWRLSGNIQLGSGGSNAQ